MKRKKWTEEEEAALIREYSELAASGTLPRLKTRERKFQPIADRVNALHHLLDPAAFPFRWSWRDVSIKIQNMRHQYVGVKYKIRLPPSSSSSSSSSSFDWPSGDHHWPNFLRYKQVFGDIDLDSAPFPANKTLSEAGGEGERGEDDEEVEEEEDNDYDDGVIEGLVNGEVEAAGGDGKNPAAGEVRAQRRREREREHQREMEEMAAIQEKQWRWSEEERDRWRRREERWEEEEMQWRARLVGMQMEHEKQVMQMHVDACQSQTQMLGILVRLVCQFLGAAGGGDAGLGGLSHQVLHNLQQQQHHQQQDQGSMGADNGKSDASSAGHYM